MNATLYRGRMTRTYAARKLLEHGPLTQPELLEITGWKPREVSLVTQRLMTDGVVKVMHLNRTRCYALESQSIAAGLQHLTEPMQSQHLTIMTSLCRGWN